MRLVVLARENGLPEAEAWLQRKLTEYRERTASKALFLRKGAWNDSGFAKDCWASSLHDLIDGGSKAEIPVKGQGNQPRAGNGSWLTKSGSAHPETRLAGRFLTTTEAKQAFADKVSAAGGHYIWEANGDEAIIISPDHKIKHLPFEEAKPFWAKLFELEEQIEDPDQLQLAIDDYCATFFPAEDNPESEEAEEFWSNPNQFSMFSSLLKTGGDLHNRVEKASAELAKMWEKVKPALLKGYAIEHHLHLVQQNLQQGLDLIPTQPEVAAVYISTAEDTLRKANEEIAHLEI